MTSQERLVELIQEHSEFVAALETDPLDALRDEGFDDFAVAVEAERDRIGELIDRIYRDAEFRQAVEQDPARELGKCGVSELAFEPVLVLAGAPADVIERVTEDVEAHMSRKPATVAALAAVLGTLAFAQQATAAQPTQVSAQVAAQSVKPAGSSAQAAQAQVTQQGVAAAQKKRQTVQPARTAWQGVQAAQLRGQGISLLRAQARRR